MLYLIKFLSAGEQIHFAHFAYESTPGNEIWAGRLPGQGTYVWPYDVGRQWMSDAGPKFQAKLEL